ncbi:MAG TPA: sugar ABC transporter permease [Thermomicrobiales bacterium]|nr:sugar ABC transporter permease [Thermomicrobiales bacterium]
MASEHTLPGSATTSQAAARRRPSDAPFRWGMSLPTIVALLAVIAFPLAFALWVSLHNYDLTKGGIGAFTGFVNYADILGNDLYQTAARNTVVYSASVVILELLVALGLSLLLNQPGLRFRAVYLGILLIPLLVSPVAVGLIWRLLLHPDLGALNWMFGLVGLPKQAWLGGQASAMPTVIGVDVWHETSLMIVIILAGLTALPRDPIEAAMVDGASRWQVLRTVTLPLLAPVMLVAALIRMISAFKTYDLIYILTRGGPGTATETISYTIWKQAFTSLEMGKAAAASFLLLIVIMCLTIVLIRVMPHDEA